MNISKTVVNANVTFPDFTGERVYMHKFHMGQRLPEHLQRWKDTVGAMLTGVDTDNPIFLMIDQGVVKVNNTHRRPGPHVDGYWIEGISAHGNSSGWSHDRPSESAHKFTPGRHTTVVEEPGSHQYRRHSFSGNTEYQLIHPEAVILASDIQACRGYVGEWSGVIGDGGDLSHLDLSHLQTIDLQPHTSYIGNVGFIHESLPIPFDCNRTLVRLNVKNWEPKQFN